MARTFSPESVIEMAASLKQDVQSLIKHYSSLAPIISNEHNAIKNHDLSAIEDAQKSKLDIGQQIELIFESLKEKASTLTGWHDTFFESDHGSKPPSLSLCIEYIKKLREKFPTSGLSVQIIDHQTKALDELFAKLQKVMSEVKPVIETNKLVLQKMAFNYQESYRFWKELDAELTASYNAQGLQKSSENNSVLRVKA